MRDISIADKKKRVKAWLNDHYWGFKMDDRPEVIPGSMLHTLLLLDNTLDEIIGECCTCHSESFLFDQRTDIYLAMYNLVKMAEKGGWNA